jgi:PAS domain S-box-containing protein
VWSEAQPRLLRLARRAVADRDVEGVAAEGAALARELLGVDLVGIRELARDGRTLGARAAAGSWPGEPGRADVIRVEQAPLIELALDADRSIWSERIDEDDRLRRSPTNLFAMGVESVLVSPLRGHSGQIGVLSALSLTRRRFDDELVDLFEAIAELLGAAFQRRRDDEELRKAEQRYRTLVESAPVCIQGIDRTARIDAINEAGLRMTGLTRDAAIGRSYLDLVAPGDRPRVAMLLSQALEGRPSEFEFESADSERAFASSFIPLRGGSGDIEALIGVTQDVTARRRAEAVLRASEERYRELFENASEAIVTCDLDGRITSLNPAAQALAGLEIGAAIGRPLSDVVDVETLLRARGRAQEALEAGRDGVTEPLVVVHAYDGREVPVEASVRYARRNGVPVGFQIIARDVSERTRLEGQLRQAQKMDALGRLAGGVAHDFNNLVTAIAGYAELAQRAAPPGEDRLAHDLASIVDAAGRASSLTRQLLAFSRTEVVEPRVFDAAALVADMEEMLAGLAGEDVRLEVSAGEGCCVEADPGQLEQVVLNLVVNARDAMPAGGTLRLGCEAVPGGELVRLTVSDTGIGMTEEVRARLFEPFFTTKEHGRGTGLGLSTVYGVVDAWGGAISVESVPGEGTVFTVDLPRHDRSPSGGGRVPVADLPGGDETVLVVEDEDVVRTLARRVLSQAGYTVLEASSGDEALALCAAHAGPIDLVLTDVVMPGLSGADVVAEATRLRPDARCLVMSGYPDDAVLGRGIPAGTELLPKPFAPATLVRRVRDVLDGAERLRAPSGPGVTLA